MAKPVVYEALTDIELEETRNAQRNILRARPLSQWVVVLITMILTTTVICSFQAIYFSFRPHPVCSLERFHTGASTEWDLLTKSIEPSLVTFTGAFRYNESDKTYYREVDKNEPQYVGEPSSETDHAWHELLKGT